MFRPSQHHLTDLLQDFPDLFGHMDRSRPYPTRPMGPHPKALSNLQSVWPPITPGTYGLTRSRGPHVMTAQPRVTHAASSAGRLTGSPGTWGFQPSFPAIYFYLIAY